MNDWIKRFTFLVQDLVYISVHTELKLPTNTAVVDKWLNNEIIISDYTLTALVNNNIPCFNQAFKNSTWLASKVL